MSFYGVCFEPYVGPFVGGQPVLFNAYTVADVADLLKPLRGLFDRIATYGQGTFVWQGVPRIQDSNMWIIEAAAAASLKVTAGCYQQGAEPLKDSINVEWTKTEIEYAILKARVYGNVDELVIGNECIWGPNSAAAITQLINYAKSKLRGLPIKVTTRQRWDVLAGVDDHTPTYAATRRAIIDMIAACDGFVYADIYPYFDSSISAAIGPTPTQAHFSEVVTTSFQGSFNALAKAFADNGVTAEIRVGEVGWPTSGSQQAQPNPALANTTYAKWHCDAISTFLDANKIKGFLFEAYNEPWKGNQLSSNSEACFGLWVAEGSAGSPGQYTLTGERAKYAP